MRRRNNHNRHRIQSQTLKLNSESKKYMPLYGTWLIDLALVFGWHECESKNCWPDIFGDDSFCALTGLTRHEEPDDDEEESPVPISTMRCRAKLLMQRKKLQKMELPGDLPLLNNIDLFGELLGLNEAEKRLLTFAAGLDAVTEFKDAISCRSEKTSIASLCQALGRITGTGEAALSKALQRDSILLTTGLLEISRHGSNDLEDKLNLMSGLADILLTRHDSTNDLVSRFMKKAAAPTLTLENFPHLQRDAELLSAYMRNALLNQERGVNVILHGKPGVGKNEFAQALAEDLQVELFEVSFSDEDGDPIKGQARFKAFALCQKLLGSHGNALLLFDEIEDVFPGGGFSFFSMLFGGNSAENGRGSSGKAWINRTMENNPVPAIWISNQIRQIDKAYLRRFDYSVSFPTPPHDIRVTMAEHHLAIFEPPRAWLEKLASNEQITPAQFERAAKVARLGCNDDNRQALKLVEQTLDRSTSLLGQKKTPIRNILRTGYSLQWLNTDMPIERLVDAVKRRPMGTFCFYGVAGTGKSELARYMADQSGKPLIVKRASDILGMYVGETEQNIAAMFSEAREQDAVLVLDEADSFLSDRRDAQRSWEVTQVNELLTQMEAFEGIFICTTNLMSKLDQASLRRFAFKVRFDPLNPEQRVALFRQELVRLGGDKSEGAAWEPQVARLEQLTPGDFAVAARQFELWDEAATADRLYETLKMECEAKGAVPRKIGFGV